MERRKYKWVAVLCASAVVFALTLTALVLHLLPKENDPGTVESVPPPVSSVTEELADNPKSFDELQAVNPDVRGWLTVPGTSVDYAIMQSSDEEEDFYLSHDMDGNYKFAGSIYIQKINYGDFSDPNTIVYGHNMINGSMFGTLKRFRNKEFFDQNEYFYIYAPGHIYTYRIFSAFVYDNRHIIYSFNFHSEDGYAAFLEQALNPASMARNVREGVSVTTADKIVTLSTCTSNDNERYLVEGVLINDQLTK